MSSAITSSKLFQPLAIGPYTLSSRIIMGPISSNLADSDHVLSDAAVEYYSTRAAVAGTLLIGEATFVNPEASGTLEARSGVYTQQQISSWRNIVTAVHNRHSFIFLQLWALGRSADPIVKQRDGTGDLVSSSAVAETPTSPIPRALTELEIEEYISAFVTAAKNAVEQAGFDGIELHAGNGSLIDQFTQDVVNRRDDAWGGSIANRNRFAIEITRAVSQAVGPQKVGVRISPYSTYAGMGMKDPVPQFTHLLEELKKLEIGYVHLVESRIAGRVDAEPCGSLKPFIDVWDSAAPIIAAGGYSPDTARVAVDEEYRDLDVGIAFGRAFVTNPDLVARLRNGQDLVTE